MRDGAPAAPNPMVGQRPLDVERGEFARRLPPQSIPGPVEPKPPANRPPADDAALEEHLAYWFNNQGPIERLRGGGSLFLVLRGLLEERERRLTPLE